MRLYQGWTACRWLLATSMFYYSTSAQICTGLTPVVFDISNVTTTDGSVVRGLRFQYGSPVQTLSLNVVTAKNETYLYDGMLGCEYPASCAAARGGAFAYSSSQTWQNILLQDLKSFDNVHFSGDEYVHAGSDMLVVNSSLSKGLTVLTDKDYVYGSVGLGKSSRLLTLLQNSGLIASFSFSMFWGQTGISETNAHNGAVVLGGYDRSQISGTKYTASIRPPYTSGCESGLIVSLSDMKLAWPGQRSVSLLSLSPEGTVLSYCVDSNFDVISMPTNIWGTWLMSDPVLNGDVVSGGTPDAPNVNGRLFRPQDMTKADLVLSIDGEIDITIPNHQLSQAYYTYNDDGSIIVNDTYQELMISPLLNDHSNDFPRLGKTFLQAAYLNVNYDTNHFTLWQAANPAAAGDYVAVAHPIHGCSTESVGNNNNTVSDGGNQQSHHKHSSLSAGAIAGIVLAAMVFLVCVTLLFWWHRRRKVANSRNRPESHTSTPLQPAATGEHGERVSYQDHKAGPETQLHTGPGISPKPELDGFSDDKALSYGVHQVANRPQEMP